jgi:hypothetical protein
MQCEDFFGTVAEDGTLTPQNPPDLLTVGFGGSRPEGERISC